MRHIICYFTFVLFQIGFTQTTTQVTLSSGDGWYRIIETGGHTTGHIRLHGTLGNNILTDMSMYVSMMAYNQGGSINIVNNKYYNHNHIDEIRAGTSNGKYVLDVHMVNISSPATLNVVSDGPPVLSTPIYNPSGSITGEIEISGRVIGTHSTRWPIYFSNNVGIGTSSPASKLDVEGGDLYVGEQVSANGNRRQIRVYGYDNSEKFYGSIHSNYDESQRTFDISTNDKVGQIKIDASANSTANIILDPGASGNVGIGTSNLDSKLTVAGNIHAREVKVTVDAGADFVFEENYNLPSLKALEAFIKAKKHLPEIASEKEMQENGLHLAEMNIKLLQKIEELTLYIIQQEKQLKVQNLENEELENRLLKLEQIILNKTQE